MVQLKILSGSRKGAAHLAQEFPCVIGRAAGSQLRLEEAGIWEQHLKLALVYPDGFQLEVQPGAIASVNGQPCQQTRLRNGDVIELGSVKLQFWLGEVAQPALTTRERLTWCIIFLLLVFQLALVLWLVR
jgi:pSer/pThr/pTyr-binding forkhead associated (FHA) protein